MNIQSIILLALVLAAFGIVLYRYVQRQRRGRGACNCGSCDGCNGCQ